MKYKYVKTDDGSYRIFVEDIPSETLPENWKYINLIEYYKYLISISTLYELKLKPFLHIL